MRGEPDGSGIGNQRVTKLMFIQEFQIPLYNFKNLSAKPANHTVRGQQVVASYTILV
jgi:hypothetical protein